MESLRRPIMEVTRYKKEILDTETQIRTISTQLQDVGGARTIEDIQKDLHALNEKAQGFRSQISEMQSEKERQRQNITMLENALRDSREKLTNIKHQLDTMRSLKDQLVDVRENIQNQRSIVEKADSEIEALSPQLVKVQSKVKDISEAGAERERKQQRETSRLYDSYTQLKNLDDEIKNYLASGKEKTLTNCVRDVEVLQQELVELNQKLASNTQNLNKAMEDKATTRNTKQTIIANLQYRQHKSNLSTLLAEIAELESQNAEADRDRFQLEAKRRQDRHMRLNAKRSEIAGSMKSKDNELVQLVRDFEIDFKDAKDNFRKSTVKVQTTKAAIDDLTKYSGALDKYFPYKSLTSLTINV